MFTLKERALLAVRNCLVKAFMKPCLTDEDLQTLADWLTAYLHPSARQPLLMITDLCYEDMDSIRELIESLDELPKYVSSMQRNAIRLAPLLHVTDLNVCIYPKMDTTECNDLDFTRFKKLVINIKWCYINRTPMFTKAYSIVNEYFRTMVNVTDLTLCNSSEGQLIAIGRYCRNLLELTLRGKYDSGIFLLKLITLSNYKILFTGVNDVLKNSETVCTGLRKMCVFVVEMEQYVLAILLSVFPSLMLHNDGQDNNTHYELPCIHDTSVLLDNLFNKSYSRVETIKKSKLPYIVDPIPLSGLLPNTFSMLQKISVSLGEDYHSFGILHLPSLRELHIHSSQWRYLIHFLKFTGQPVYNLLLMVDSNSLRISRSDFSRISEYCPNLMTFQMKMPAVVMDRDDEKYLCTPNTDIFPHVTFMSLKLFMEGERLEIPVLKFLLAAKCLKAVEIVSMMALPSNQLGSLLKSPFFTRAEIFMHVGLISQYLDVLEILKASPKLKFTVLQPAYISSHTLNGYETRISSHDENDYISYIEECATKYNSVREAGYVEFKRLIINQWPECEMPFIGCKWYNCY